MGKHSDNAAEAVLDPGRLASIVEAVPGVVEMEAGIESWRRTIDDRFFHRNNDKQAQRGRIIDKEQHLVTVEVALESTARIVKVVEDIQKAVKEALQDALPADASDYTVLVRVQSIR